MPYDFEGLQDRSPPKINSVVPDPDPRDLEAIVTIILVAAIELTPNEGSEFTFDELMVQIHQYSGSEPAFREIDVSIVLNSSKLLRKRPGKKYQLS